MLLRPRQKKLVARTVTALAKHKNTLAVAPTGAGKTIMLSALIGNFFQNGISKACVLAHRDELTFQNQNKFQRVNPHISTSIFNASIKAWDGDVVFAMVQTLSRPNNLETMPALDVLVIDEAHHARAESYLQVIRYAQKVNPFIKLVGMTATPNRGDKLGLRPIFDNVADQIRVRELISSGHLVTPRTFVMDIGVRDDLNNVRKTALDYDMDAVADIMNKLPIHEAVIEHWQEKAKDRKTVVFCSTVQHACDVAASFNRAGIKAVYVHGGMSEAERHFTLEKYTTGDAQVIVNVAILTEGWDHPPTSCVVLLRPSSYKSTMIQMIGRGLRTIDPHEFPDIIKKDCIILDFGTASLIHGTLEQEINLDDDAEQNNDLDYKICPECSSSVPQSAKECAICGYIWKSDKVAKNSLSDDDFLMKEIDLLKCSNFLWDNPNGVNDHFIATGLNVWAGVFYKYDNWHAVGGGKNTSPKLLATGERLVCFAAADDYLNLFENQYSAHKTQAWLYQPATDKQREYLPDNLQNSDLTRYQASALIIMRFNRHAINRAINHGRVYDYVN